MMLSVSVHSKMIHLIYCMLCESILSYVNECRLTLYSIVQYCATALLSYQPTLTIQGYMVMLLHDIVYKLRVG